MDYIQILELLGAAVGGGWITHLLTIRQRVRQEKAKTEADNIENVKNIVNDVYQPIIDNLRKQVQAATTEAAEARRQANKAMSKVEALEAENRELMRENAQLREAIREINPDLVPSKRGENGRNQRRAANGQFTRKELKPEREAGEA